MKLNRERFLFAAIALSAASSGCNFKPGSAAADISPEQQMQQQAAQTPPLAAPAPEVNGTDTSSPDSKSGIKAGTAPRVAGSPTKEAQLASPTKEAIGTSPTKEAIGTSPTKEAISTSPTKEVIKTSPTKEAVTTSPTKEAPYKPPAPTKEIGVKPK